MKRPPRQFNRLAVAQPQLALAHYEHDLREFEERGQLGSAEFYQRLESGELGDNMDYFEWAGLWEPK
jgi:hypothetical protein